MQILHGSIDAVGQSEVVCIHNESPHWHESIKVRRREDDITVLWVMGLASAELAMVTPLGVVAGEAYFPFSCSSIRFLNSPISRSV